MTKQVFVNDMVAHVWAQHTQSSGRSHNGNYSFEGPTLYSYSTAIARLHGNVALVTSRTYSMTTSSKHMPPIWGALGPDIQTFRVPNVNPIGDGHEANLAHLVGEYNYAAGRAKRARDVGSWHWSTMTRTADQAADYAVWSGLPVPAINAAKDIEAIRAYRAERDARLNTPEIAAKREADRIKRAERKERAAAEARRLALLSAAERIEAWRNGANVVLPWDARRDENGGAMLRVSGDKLETSQGATVPLSHAIRVFAFAKLCRERGEAWQRNGRTLRVGHFQVDSVAPDGSFVAGCHRIYWPEIERAAVQADVADMAAADTRDVKAAA